LVAVNPLAVLAAFSGTDTESLGAAEDIVRVLADDLKKPLKNY